MTWTSTRTMGRLQRSAMAAARAMRVWPGIGMKAQNSPTKQALPTEARWRCQRDGSCRRCRMGRNSGRSRIASAVGRYRSKNPRGINPLCPVELLKTRARSADRIRRGGVGRTRASHRGGRCNGPGCVVRRAAFRAGLPSAGRRWDSVARGRRSPPAASGSMWGQCVLARPAWRSRLSACPCARTCQRVSRAACWRRPDAVSRRGTDCA